MIALSSFSLAFLAFGLKAIAAPPGLITGIRVAGDVNANPFLTVNRVGSSIGGVTTPLRGVVNGVASSGAGVNVGTSDTVNDNDRREYEYTYNSKDFAKEYGYDGKHHKHPEHKSDEMIKAEAEGLVQT
ncbi:hypothetical protein PENSPDRAFT_65800 [Peniophora sp. CONT]|nr:hypothetical protein PENSPDRAFT_65800 [Peniophora sp. CONT]